jgi:hypothetical protein
MLIFSQDGMLYVLEPRSALIEMPTNHSDDRRQLQLPQRLMTYFRHKQALVRTSVAFGASNGPQHPSSFEFSVQPTHSAPNITILGLGHFNAEPLTPTSPRLSQSTEFVLYPS